MKIIRTSENTILILFEQIIEPDNFSKINQLTYRIKKDMAAFLIDMIPSYASIHITFNLLLISGMEFKQLLSNLLNPIEFDITAARLAQSRLPLASYLTMKISPEPSLTSDTSPKVMVPLKFPVTKTLPLASDATPLPMFTEPSPTPPMAFNTAPVESRRTVKTSLPAVATSVCVPKTAVPINSPVMAI